MLRLFPLLVVIGALFPSVASSADPKPRYAAVAVSAAEISAYLQELSARSNVRRVERTHCTLLDAQDDWSVYVFTKVGHPAHPAVFVLHAEQEHHGVSRRRAWGHTAGDRQAFSRLLDDERAPALREKKLLARSCDQ
jgi:hypothetical protein